MDQSMGQDMTGSTRVHKKWTKDEDEHLRRLINQFGDQNWKTIAEYFPERTFEQCRQRWRYTLNPENIKERWTNHEDKVLLEKYREVGNKWAKIASFLPGRTNKKVRDRWRTLNAKSGTDLQASNPYHTTGNGGFQDTQFRGQQQGAGVVAHPQTHYSTMNKKSNQPRRVHNKWSKDEDEKLRNLIAQFGDQNWKTIAEYFPERTFEQCRQRWRYTLSEAENIKQGWSKQEDKILLEKCCEFGNKWAKIAKFLPGRTNKKVRDRWRSLNSKTIPTANGGAAGGGRAPHTKGAGGFKSIPPGSKSKGGEFENAANNKKWSTEEDVKLRWLVAQYGDSKWKAIASYFPEKTFEQCRQRWRNTLNPDINKKPWTNEEDKILLDKYREFGNQFAKIAKFLSGRTNIGCRDRWRTLSGKTSTKPRNNSVDDTKSSLESILKVMKSPAAPKKSKSQTSASAAAAVAQSVSILPTTTVKYPAAENTAHHPTYQNYLTQGTSIQPWQTQGAVGNCFMYGGTPTYR